MAYSEEKAMEAVKHVVKIAELSREVTEVIYRDDYEDYQVVLDDKLHCEIREKLITDFYEHRHDDVLREIIFRVKNATAFEEWEERGKGGEAAPHSPKDDCVIDDSDKYDF